MKSPEPIALDDEDQQLLAEIRRNHVATRQIELAGVERFIATGAALARLRDKHARRWQRFVNDENSRLPFRPTQTKTYILLHTHQQLVRSVVNDYLADDSAEPPQQGGAAGCRELLMRRLKPHRVPPPRKSPRQRTAELLEQFRCAEECAAKLARGYYDLCAERGEIPTVLNEIDSARIGQGLPPIALAPSTEVREPVSSGEELSMENGRSTDRF